MILICQLYLAGLVNDNNEVIGKLTIAIELLIGIIAFSIAGEKTHFGEIAFMLKLGTVLFVLIAFGLRRVRISK